METQKQTPRNLIIPAEALDDFAKLILLPASTLDAIYRRISHGLYSLDKMTIDIINETGLDDDDAFSVMTVVCYLNSAAEDRQLSPEEVLEEVKLKFISSRIDDKRKSEVLAAIEGCRPNLMKLISKEVRSPIEEKRKRLAKPPYKPAVNFQTICDIRPIFDEGAENITDKMIVTLLDITYEDEDGEERHFVLTMDEKALEKLESAMSRTRKKTALLEESNLTVD